MGEKTRKNNDQEDELNQSRFFTERGAEVVDTEEPGEDGPVIEEEDILDSKSRFREQPAVEHEESKIAENSRFYGQGFPIRKDEDAGIQRVPRSENPEDKPSLGE